MISKVRIGALLPLVFVATSSCFAQEVRGRVLWEGPVPAPERIPIVPKEGDHSTEGCGSEKISQKLEVAAAGGGIKNVVVWIQAPASHGPIFRENPPASVGPVVLDQKACEFSPHLLLVPPGGRMLMRNSDPIRHNLRIFDGAKMLMHAWQKADGADVAWRFERPGRYLVRCGVHPWMHAWVVAAGHPFYAVSDAQGRFTIADLPAGSYTLHLWHEVLGERQQPLELNKAQGVDLAPILFSKKEA